MNNVRLLLFALVAFVAGHVVAAFHSAPTKILETIHSWKQMEYDFPTQQERQDAVNSGNLVIGTGTLTDVGVYYQVNNTRRIFVTIPRRPGVPYSLAVVTDKLGTNGPIIEAYPDYASHIMKPAAVNCQNIISAFRVAIDECHRMWVMDLGLVEAVQVCPPKLLVFDLLTNSLMFKLEVPPDLYHAKYSLLTTPIVDVRDANEGCSKTMVYIPDVYQPGLVVYDQQKNFTWRVESLLMYGYPNLSNHTIAGESFELMAGIFGLSVDPPTKAGDRMLYFHALSSYTENAVPLRLLDDVSPSSGNPQATEIGSRGVQCTVEAMDGRGFLYCVTMDPIRLLAWHISSPYHPDFMTVLSTDVTTLQFASGLKVVRNPSGEEELWIATNRFQKIAAKTLNPNEVNYRILFAKLKDLWKGHECSQSPPSMLFYGYY